MPSRLRQKSGAGDLTAQQEKAYNIPALDFHDTLSWRAGKAIPVADLLSRLQSLSTALRNVDADQIESRQYTSLAGDLANANLLGHKDKGVRAWTVSCIVDVLKICAPDAPFKDTQLKDIFTVIINSIIRALEDPTNAYNSQHIYILNSLAESQSILLLTDIPNPDSLITSLFTNSFDVVSASGNNTAGVELSKSVEYHLKNVLCEVVEEIALPPEVTDIIISQFMRIDARSSQEASNRTKKQDAQDTKQSTLQLKDYPPAYNMAKAICTTCVDKMTAQITQYFGTVIVDASAAVSESNPEKKLSKKRFSEVEDSDLEEDGLADLRKAHRLVKELWRACPDVLVNVVPQLETELMADAEQLRELATETLGDVISGIGIAGLPPSSRLDPSAYPLPTIAAPEPESAVTNPLLTPSSPKPFSRIHTSTYQAFLGRRLDKGPAVRAVWAKAATRILFTLAGGIGLNDGELSELLSGLAQMLHDHEERVRLAAVRGISNFTYHGVINILGADGGLATPGTVLSSLAERVADRKHQVREDAISQLANIWGVSSRDMEEGNERVAAIVTDVPNKLFGAYYKNDPSIHAALDRVVFESLVPLSFPPLKQASQSATKKQGSKQKSGTNDTDPDAVRTLRILTLFRGLDTKAKQVFLMMQGRQVQLSKAVASFLNMCEAYNGGVVEDDADEEQIKSKLSVYIDGLVKPFPDHAKMAADLWKFAKLHNRRDYQLMRFAMGAEHDYRTVFKAIKELTKRIKEGPSNAQSIIESLIPLLYRCALIIYNRSHVPTIMNVSRTDEANLGDAAHEILREISTRNPEILKTHIRDLCKELEDNAPSASKPEEPSAGDTLKACAAFARKYPLEVSKERKFLTALSSFALHSKSPRAAKNAVTILLTVTDKKDMHAKEILSKALKDCKSTTPNQLSRLATIAQICLLAPTTAEKEKDAILDLSVTQILDQNRTSADAQSSKTWISEADDETLAKELALKIVVNRCRAIDEKVNSTEFEEVAIYVRKVLMQFIEHDGKFSSPEETAPAQRNRLRLAAAKMVLKLCSNKRHFEELITPKMFVSIALIVINPPYPVRDGFVHQVKTYLGQNLLNPRWYSVLFLLAFEPEIELKISTVTWLRSRSQYFSRQQQSKSADKKAHQNILEGTFFRLLSLLAYHPDFPVKDSEEYESDLLTFSQYVAFYLVSVSTEDNLSLIFHIAQRVKQARDNITDNDSNEIDERLYVLSDLAQAVIRNYADIMPVHSKGVNLLQTWPGSISVPRSLFKALPNHDVAQQIAEKNYLPEDTASGLEKLVRGYVRSLKPGASSTKRNVHVDRKRKSGSADSDDDNEEQKRSVKKAKKTSLPLRRTPKARRINSNIPSSEQPTRKSARKSDVKYAEADSDEDDAEMEDYDQTASRSRKSNGMSNLSSPLQARRNQQASNSTEIDQPEKVNSTNEDVQIHEDNAAELEGTDDDNTNDDNTDDIDGPDGVAADKPEQESSTSPLKEKANTKARKTTSKTNTPISSKLSSTTKPKLSHTATRQSQRTRSKA